MSFSTLPLRAQTLSEVLSPETSFRLSRPAATGRFRALARGALVCPSTSAAAGHLQQRRGAVWEALGCMWWFPNECNLGCSFELSEDKTSCSSKTVLQLLGGDKCIQKTEQQVYSRKVKYFRRRWRRWVQGAGRGGQRGRRRRGGGEEGKRRAAAGQRRRRDTRPLAPAALFTKCFSVLFFRVFFENAATQPTAPRLLRGSFSSDAEDSSITSIAQLKISR